MKQQKLAAAPRWRPAADQIIRNAAELVGVPSGHICSRSRFESAVLGRNVVVRCALAVGMTGTEVAIALQISQQAVSAIYNRPMAQEVAELAQRVLARIGWNVQSDGEDRSRASGAICV